MIFFRSLSLLVQSGVPFHRSLDLLARQSDDPEMGRASQELLKDLLTGKSLSQCMAQQPLAFSPFQTGLIQVGERTGRLDLLLLRLAAYEEKSYQLKLKIRGALTYPALIFAITLLLLLLAPSLLFQGIFPLLKSQGQNLPWITQLVLFVSESMAKPGVVALLLMALGSALALLASAGRNPAHLTRLYAWGHRQPALSKFLRTLGSSRFASALALQLEAGMPVLQALQMAARSSADPILSRDIHFACKALEDGHPLDICLQQMDYFPLTFLSILRAGQESGRLPQLLRHLGQLYDLELEAAIDSLVSLIEPVVMLVMGLIVAVVVISLMLPMVSLLQGL